ncbi:cation transporter [Lentisphaerota bacterium ZTH]|nr:cation transporter [Lentisphaerota bacterium]WET06496.1 cation transporter [Lentisphaerota bacterium ZTH]
MSDRHSIVEFKALKISMIGAFLLAVWGVGMGMYTSSGAIMLDGLFNLISACMTLLSMKVTELIAGKESKQFPLGFFAFETMFVLVKGISILILIILALYFNIRVLLAGGHKPQLGIMTFYVLVAVGGCFYVYWRVRSRNRMAGSEILAAEGKGWLFNGLISSAIGVAFVIAMFLRSTSLGWICRYVDQILVILLSIVLIRDPVVLIVNSMHELLLGAPGEEYIRPYQIALEPLKERLGLNAMQLDVIKTGRRIWLTATITPRGDGILLKDLAGHEKAIREAASAVNVNTSTLVVLKP